MKKIKSYCLGKVEIYVAQDPEFKYTTARLINGKESSIQHNLDFDDAMDLYDYFLDAELGLTEDETGEEHD